jgi:hypothetical protein
MASPPSLIWPGEIWDAEDGNPYLSFGVHWQSLVILTGNATPHRAAQRPVWLPHGRVRCS